MSRVMILANNDFGLFKFRKELIEELIEQDYKVFVSVPSGEFNGVIKNLGCKVITNTLLDRRGKNPIKDIQLYGHYKSVLADIMPDIVFTYTIKPNIYGGAAAASLNIPYITNITGLGTAVCVENGGLIQYITLTLYRWGLRKAKKIFFQNIENRDFFIRKKVIHVPYDLLPGSGVNLNQFRVLEYPSGETIEFVFIGRILEEKGINQYLEAAKKIKEKYPNTMFHVCGVCEEEYESPLEELNNAGTIIYHGLVEDIVGMYKKCSCTVHPSFYPEGLSNVLLESAASGRPIITTSRSGCREVIDDKINGYIVKQQDSMDLIDKIERFLGLSREEQKKMGLEGRKIVENNFDRKIVVKKYMKELETINE